MIRCARLALALLPICLATLPGCSGLPDQALAQQALLRGDTATAQKNLAQLAGLGFPDAQTSLGDLQVATRDPAHIQQAEALYREAAVSSVRAQAHLGRLLAREGMANEAQLLEAEGLLEGAIAKGDSSAVVPLTLLHVTYPHLSPQVDPQQQIDAWRRQGIVEAEIAQILIWRADGTYAKHLDQIQSTCRAQLNREEVCYLELATVYRLRNQAKPIDDLLRQLQNAYRNNAVTAQRVESVALVLIDMQTEAPPVLEPANKVLLDLAPSYPQAWSSLAKLYADYPQIGSPELMLEYAKRGREAGDSRAELLTGRLYYAGQGYAQDPRLAEQHLLIASKEQPSAHYYLGQIYRRGYFGQAEPQKALDHLLIAARAGQAAADFALAQMFSENRGVQVNRVNAYVFAQLAVKAGVELAPPLLQSIAPTLPPVERQHADDLLTQELQSRLVAPARLARFQASDLAKEVL